MSRIKFANKKVYILLGCATVAVITYLLFYVTPKSTTSKSSNHGSFKAGSKFSFTNTEPKFEGARIVHLDLKGAPPKISYYKFLFPLLSKLGATGILMEYEDMFPFNTSMVKDISALNSYSFEDVHFINNLAAENNLEVIPLVQTFGHLEFLLKLQEFEELREVPEYPQMVCPTHTGVIPIVMEMIDQVIQMHPNSNKIHIGADEVYYLGYCDRCMNTMNREKLSKNMLYLKYVNTIASKIHEKYPRLKILLWDDKFRSFTTEELIKGKPHKSLEPVVWKYSKEVYEELGPSLWDMYSEVFPKVWTASAFKGATGSSQYVSEVTHYVQNHRSWMSIINEYKNRVNFQGILITGWQRYDHFAILCELLPVSLPSLGMSLRVILGYNDSPLSPPIQVAKALNCIQPYGLIGSAFGSPRCSYPGGDILENVLRLQALRQEFDDILQDSRVKGWMNPYNRNHEFSNPQYVQAATVPLNRIMEELRQVNSEMSIAMGEIYDNFTISEWKETHLEPFEKEIADLLEARDRILSKTSWPKRPLPNEL